MPYKKGESGNPAGRPKGCINHRTTFINALKANSSNEEDFAQKISKLAEQGNATAIQVVASRLWKENKATLPPVQLPEADSKSEHAMNVINGMADGTITPDQGQAIMTVLRGAAELSEIDELLERIRKLEGLA